MEIQRGRLFVATLILGLSAVTGMAPAEAETLDRGFFQNGGSACTGALPTFEGSLRKRPKAIANEGAATAFVTCSAVANFMNSAKPYLVFVAVTNRGTAAVDLNCTLVNGDEFNGSTAFPATISLAVNALEFIQWLPDGELEFQHDAVSISCALPPRVEINYFGQDVFEDVGT